MTPKEYDALVRQLSPSSPIGKDTALAFVVGGGICAVGQLIANGWQALGLTQQEAASATSVTLVFLSVLLNSKIAFKNGFRAVFFIPYTLSVLVIGYVFKYIFMNPLPELGKALGIKWLSTSLLTNEQLSWIPIVFLAVWQGIAYSVLIYLAGLQTIDDEIYEAAAIDGVNAWQKFWKITFPLIGPFFTINLVLSMKNALGTFDQVVALTEGGPNSSTETVTYLIWKGGLTGGEYAYQTANAVLFFIVLAIIAFVQLRISRSQEQI